MYMTDTKMTKGEAITLMKSSLDVDDWNQKRELVKSNIADTDRDQTMVEIDCQGLINKVVKPVTYSRS